MLKKKLLFTRTMPSSDVQVPEEEIRLKILSLNCWGLVGVSYHRNERMQAIASYLATQAFDVVFLQEVWNYDDFLLISKKVHQLLPFSHYFHSGVLGSGLCILSKAEIKRTIMFPYSLNGTPFRIWHGDWMGGKGVGLCHVELYGLKVNLYVTHLHAEYNRNNDIYLSHRIVQAVDLVKFIEFTKDGADLLILGGDLNSEPGDLPYCIIQQAGGFHDSFLAFCQNIDDNKGATCGHPRNTYTTNVELKMAPSGKRIDYIMYRVGGHSSGPVLLHDKKVKCVNFDVPMTETTLSKVCFSDHEPCVATLAISSSPTEDYTEPPQERLVQVLQESNTLVLQGIKHAQSTKQVCFVVSIWCFVALLVLAIVSSHFLKREQPAHWVFSYIVFLLQVCLSVVTTCCIVTSFIIKPTELRAFKECHKYFDRYLEKYSSPTFGSLLASNALR